MILFVEGPGGLGDLVLFRGTLDPCAHHVFVSTDLNFILQFFRNMGRITLKSRASRRNGQRLGNYQKMGASDGSENVSWEEANRLIENAKEEAGHLSDVLHSYDSHIERLRNQHARRIDRVNDMENEVRLGKSRWKSAGGKLSKKFPVMISSRLQARRL